MRIDQIMPISINEPTKGIYTSRINPIKREIEYQNRQKFQKKQKLKLVSEKMNQMAKSFTEVMLSYDANMNATNPYYYSFDKVI